MASGVKTFLSSIGMGRHFQMFQTRGYDDEADIPYLSSSDLTCIGVSDPMEIIKILKFAKCYKESSEYALVRWLRDHGLEHYMEGFVQSDLTHLSDVAQLNLPSEDLYDELEITLPGHQRRLERAVCALRKKQRQGSSEKEEEDLVTEGWWGFPTYLPNAKYPFLCVQANIKSTRPLATPKSMDFMIDSGSDVSTMREEIIQDLNLEPITTVKSCGVYGSQRTTMYRAYLTIGDCKLEIEVIGSSYDSLGSRVLRHFHHRIDNNRHKWFRASNSSSLNNNTNQESQNSDDDQEEVAETVSIFPSGAQRTASQSETQRNSTVSKSQNSESTSTNSSIDRRGDGGSGGMCGVTGREVSEPFQETEESALHVDETDSLRQQNYTALQTNSSQKRSRGGKIKDSKPLQSTHQALHSSTSSSSLKEFHASPEDSASSGVVRLLTDKSYVQPQDSRQKGSHQGGHLKLSGDGTGSLSFGGERRPENQNHSHDAT